MFIKLLCHVLSTVFISTVAAINQIKYLLDYYFAKYIRFLNHMNYSLVPSSLDILLRHLKQFQNKDYTHYLKRDILQFINSKY